MIDLALIKSQGLLDEGTTEAQDQMAQSVIYPTIELVCHYLNNWFIPQTYLPCSNCYVPRPTREFLDGTISPVYDVLAGDLIRVNGVRNRYVSYIQSIENSTINIDNTELVNTKEPAQIDIMVLPKAVQIAIAQMINYDCYTRDGIESSLKSETIGNYSYTINDNVKRIGSFDYPVQIVNTLENYAKLKRF